MRSPATPRPRCQAPTQGKRRSLLRALGSLATFALVSAGFVGAQSLSSAPPAQAAVSIRNLNGSNWAWASVGPWRQVYSVEVSAQVGESVDVPANYTNQNNFQEWYSKNEYNATAANGKIPTSAGAYGQVPIGLHLTPDMRLTGKVADNVRPGTYYVKYGFNVYPSFFWGTITMWGVYKVNVQAKPTKKPPAVGTVVQNLDGGSWAWADKSNWRQVYSQGVTVGRGSSINVAPNITHRTNFHSFYEENQRSATRPNGKVPNSLGSLGQIPKGLRLDNDMRLIGTVSSDVQPGTYYVKYGMRVYPNFFWGYITMWGVYKVVVNPDPKPITVSPARPAKTEVRNLGSDSWAWADKSNWRQVRSREVLIARNGLADVKPNYLNTNNFVANLHNRNYKRATVPNGRIPRDEGAYGQLPKGLSLRADNTLYGTVSRDVQPGTYYVKYGFKVYPNFFWGDIAMWGVYKIVVR